jgi:hypothetical protein
MTFVTRASILEDELAEIRTRRERFTACRSEIESAEGGQADALAAAIAQHLAAIRPDELLGAAQPIWLERIAKPLKADATKPLAARDISRIRSWPTARIEDLLAAITDIEALLVVAEIDAQNEVIYAEISRTYS